MTRFPSLSILLFYAALTHALVAEEVLLLHWNFDEGEGAVIKDISSAGNDATMKAQWEASPLGAAAMLDGKAGSVVSARLPEANRLAKGSWTVTGWIKPQQFTYVGSMNQRRLFSYGAYPQAFFCVDILGTGAVGFHSIYKAGEKSIMANATSFNALMLNRWAHIAVVCDSNARLASIYINGRLRNEQKLPPEFDIDFTANGDFTVGSDWQNYHGAADEVRLYKRALPAAEITSLFEPLKDVYGVLPSDAEEPADPLQAFQSGFIATDTAWAKKDFAAASAALSKLVTKTNLPSHYRSYAHLRLAQSHLAGGNPTQAKGEYAKIAANPDYPQVHRSEATELINELERTSKGLPARDPKATQVHLPAQTPNAPAHLIHVAPAQPLGAGNDSNDGTAALPFATLQKARDTARSLRGKKSVEIILAPGEYRVTDTLMLDEKDSGTPATPVIYRAQVAGTAILYGGTRLTGFNPVVDEGILARLPAEAQGKVFQLDLKASGITDYGELGVRGHGQAPSPPTLELYTNGEPQTLARWPNTGFVKPTKLVDPGDEKAGKPSVLGYEDERHARWAAAEDGWLFGYFRYLWADATARIGQIDPANKTITTATPYVYAGFHMEDKQGIIYHAFNLLEEIDSPGEWYLNRQTGILYLYPATDLSKATVELSLLSKPMVDAKNLADLRFEGLVFDLSRGDGIVLRDSKNVTLAGCTVKRMAGNGISVLGGFRNTLLSCDIHTIGCRATEVIGGDRTTLTPGEHVVANCRIHNFGSIDRTYTPGVQLEGVGNRVAHNLFYNCPSSAIRIEGNDHLIEYNEVHDAVLESDDQGAMELYRNPTYRGVIFRHNSFARIGVPPGQQMEHGQSGIRFDDAISGMLVYGNIFYKAANGNFGGIQMNSGRDNIMDNNIFAECEQGISGGYHNNNTSWRQIRGGKAPPDFLTSDLYLKRYPEIATMTKDPGFNYMWRNVFYKCGSDVKGNRNALDMLANGIFETDPGFVDAANGDFQLKSDATLFESIGFRPVPVNEIGLYEDQWRKDP